MKRLLEIQKALKVPKDQYNSFGNYKFRNCEDILENLKPLLEPRNLVLLLNDEIVNIESRFYVKATATLWDVEVNQELVHTTAFAREEESKKGMDGSQVTGASSSYARKYALNGLFAIDDNKDSDTTNKHGKDETPAKKPAAKPAAKKDDDKFVPDVIKKQDDIEILEGVTELNSDEECTNYWNKWVGKLSGAEARKQLAELLKQRREALGV